MTSLTPVDICQIKKVDVFDITIIKHFASLHRNLSISVTQQLWKDIGFIYLYRTQI